MVADAATNRGRTSSEQTAPRGRSPPIVSSPVDPLSVRRQRIEPDLPSLVWEGLRLLAPVHIPRRRARPGLRRALLNRNFRVGLSRVGVIVRPHIPGCKKDLQGKRLDSRGSSMSVVRENSINDLASAEWAGAELVWSSPRRRCAQPTCELGMARALVAALESAISRPPATTRLVFSRSRRSRRRTPTAALSGSSALVSMVQPTHFRRRDDPTSAWSLHWSRFGCILQ